MAKWDAQQYSTQQYGAYAAYWTCNPCGSWNYTSAKKCWKCGIKKSYAQAVAQTQPPATTWQPPTSQTWGAGLECLATQPNASATAPPETERAELIRRLKQVDAAISQLDGPAFEDARAPLMRQQEELKRAISATRSAGARLDGCRGALTRAKGRAEKTEEELARTAAQAKLAQEAVTKLEAELAELEQDLVMQDKQTEGDASLDALHSQMNQIVTQMTGSGNVSMDEVQEATQQMQLLFAGLQTIQAAALARASVRPPASILTMLGARTPDGRSPTSLPVTSQNSPVNTVQPVAGFQSPPTGAQLLQPLGSPGAPA